MYEMTPEQRAFVHPMRGEHAPLPDADEGARRLAEFWAVKQFGTTDTQIDAWKRGADARQRDAIASFEQPARDPEIEAVMLAMLDYWSRRGLNNAQGGGNDRYYPVDAWFVRRWLAAGGLPFALRVVEAFPRLEVDQSRASDKQPALAVATRTGDPKWWCLEVGHLGLFHVLRRAAAVAPDHAAGVAEAVRIRETAPLFLRAALAFVFPDEPFWQVDLRTAAPKKKGARYAAEAWGLVTTKLDEASIPPVLDSMARDGQPFVTDTALYGYTLVHRLGDAAAPHLLAYLAVVRDAYAKEHFATALALTETPETREFFAAKTKDKRLGKIAKAYVAR